MSRVPKNNWQPSASLENLRIRAKLLQTIRAFFSERMVLEVETPLLGHTSVTDPFIQSIPAILEVHPNQRKQFYLQTSPEYAMKRLLAAYQQAIFQISKAFRQGEVGRFHNPEFTLLEWYRPGFNHHDLMDEMDALLQLILNTAPATRKSYAELFQDFLHINPHLTTLDELMHCAQKNMLVVQDTITDKDTWFNLLMTHCIEPKLGHDNPVFLYDFPASQAALARIQAGNPPLAARFEVYVHGIELANGFHELQDAEEQRLRFEKNLLLRKKYHLNELPIDEYLLSALMNGLPDCAGVALGIDRLLMIMTGSTHIADILSFDFSRI